MLIVTAHNVTKEHRKRTLAREDGTADYEVWVGVNHKCIWRARVNGHVRDKGAAKLLRLIAGAMEEKS